jgi:adenylate cyclase
VSSRAAVPVGLLALPLIGFVLLLAAPGADLQWEDHPAHFWLVLSAGVLSGILAYATSETARERADARLLLVSLAFLCSAGFLGLHALATPKVLLDGPNEGFAMATPIGLLLAGGLAAASAMPLGPQAADAIVRRARLLQASVVGLMAIWAVVSLASLPPLDDTTPVERASGPLVVLAAVGIAAYAYAAVRYFVMYSRSRATVLFSVAIACTLLAEAMLAVAFARNWHATWWEWHLLMLFAFGTIAVAARREGPAERFSDLYLEETAAGKRDVSVLFADLEGFTSFAEGRDPREVSAMLNALFEVTIPPIVRRHGGEIDRLIGDAIMATFNTRGDQPGHARQAVEAARDLQRASAQLVESEHPDWPRFRAGVASGEALVGVLGADRGRSYTVIGDTVNVAARLESLAPVGGVAISAGTARALDDVPLRSLGEVAVKGRAEPVEAYTVEEAPGGAGSVIGT